jgi:hypothetical protein
LDIFKCFDDGLGTALGEYVEVLHEQYTIARHVENTASGAAVLFPKPRVTKIKFHPIAAKGTAGICIESAQYGPTHISQASLVLPTLMTGRGVHH